MGRKCAVPHCYTGYRKCKEKASLYRVPDDDFFLSKWQEAIAREDRPITPKDYVCEKHFKDDDILRRRIIKDVIEEYQRPRLKPDAIPSVFPDLPEFILKMVKKRRKMPVENKNNEEDNIKTKEQITNESLVKTETLSAEAEGVLQENVPEAIVQNDIDIKSEIDEHTDNSVDLQLNNNTEDPNYLTKIYHCDQCKYQTKYVHNLRTHKTKHMSGEEAYIHCEHCPNYKTKWELTFRNHLKIKHGIGKQEIFKCAQCPFETRVKLCLKRHADRHIREENKSSCKFPGYNYEDDSQSLIDIHTLSHKQEEIINISKETKSFKCTECDYETNSKTHIIRHIKSAHNTGDDTVVCVKDPKTTNVPLPSMENSELKRSKYQCLKCSYKSKSHASLLKHVFKHKYSEPIQNERLKAKIWKCPKCSYATFFQNALHHHRESECGKEVFYSVECDFNINSRSEYIKHTLGHRNISVETVTQNNIFIGEVERVCIEPDVSINYELKTEEMFKEYE